MSRPDSARISRSTGWAVVAAVLALLASHLVRAQSSAPQSALRVVVVEGEDAVNIIQQKTAVAPVVEVRDRNDLPVSGAAVTFAVSGDGATFGGLQTLTVTTDAAGRAVAAGFAPTGVGTVQINVSALYQGETATTTITQTNFTTAQEAARAGRAVQGRGAGAAGGLSMVAIGGIAAAAGAGVLVASKAAGGSASDAAQSPAAPGSSSSSLNVSGTFSGPITLATSETTGAAVITCTTNQSVAATLTLVLQPQSSGGVTGQAFTTGTLSDVSFSGSNPRCSGRELLFYPFTFFGSVTGTASNLTSTAQNVVRSDGATGSDVTTQTVTFVGSLTGGIVSGTITYRHTSVCTFPGGMCSANGSGSFPVTAR